MRLATKALALASAATLALCLSACGDDGNMDQEGAVDESSAHLVQSEVPVETVTVTGEADAPLPEESENPAELEVPACASMSADDAAQQAVESVPAFDAGSPWEFELTSRDNYDPCASLSWIVLGTRAATPAGPYQIALFHNGEYLGTATKESRAFPPEVSRVSDETISVTYRYLRDGGSPVNASGTATAQFTWDDTSETVAMSGEVPDAV